LRDDIAQQKEAEDDAAMNILVKFPIRGRVERFFSTLDTYRSHESGKHLVQYVVSCDTDDPDMLDASGRLDSYDRLGYRYLLNGSKIAACNADMDLADPNWEVLILASDDMLPQVVGWDDRIASDMRREFPDTDGCLWYYDGRVKSICTLSIMGRAYYDRFGYIYHPAYTSLWCDNEFTEVAMAAGKMWKSDDVIIRHEHPSYGYGEKDSLYEHNESLYGIDHAVFDRRQKEGFPK